MTEFERRRPRDDGRSISATASLPGLEIDLWHRRLPAEAGEELTIRLRATPSFETWGRAMETSDPIALWAGMVRLAWAPWLVASQMLLGASLQPRLTGPTRPSHSE
jgi:hypothetical protein